jgi:hypothetical protein
MIVELVNTMSSRDECVYQKFAVPKNTFSRARYEKEKFQSPSQRKSQSINGRFP